MIINSERFEQAGTIFLNGTLDFLGRYPTLVTGCDWNALDFKQT